MVVFPGGDLDAFKSWTDRNQIVFGARSGFARLAIEHHVPIVPIVTAGAGESLLVLTDGETSRPRLAARQAIAPQGFTDHRLAAVGNQYRRGRAASLCRSRQAAHPGARQRRGQPGENVEALAERVHTAMQDALTEMTADRLPLLG